MDKNAYIEESVQYIRSITGASPKAGIILGSGLGDFADGLEQVARIPTGDIPHYPKSTVQGHKGFLVFAKLDGIDILAFQGRKHFYESGSLDTVLFPVLVAHSMGIRTLLITNAAGGINRTFVPGDLMILGDQINLTFEHTPAWFPESNRAPVYSSRLINLAEKAARDNGILVKKGVYVGLKGPTYETASEIQMLSRLGADAVGMSTVFEASLASRLSMDVLGISCITNLGTGISPTRLSHHEVTEVGNTVKHTFARLVASTLRML